MAAHSLRWVTLNAFGMTATSGTFLACLVAGSILVAVSRRRRLPFGAIAFTSAVSMMPGAYLFRMASGPAQMTSGSRTTLEFISATISDGMTTDQSSSG
jgi:uncharacterized membrane protein YjjB (DUF3815 family)